MTEDIVVDLARLNSGQRGAVGEGPDIPPLSQAVVIGIGGSGIQTVSRIRSAILANRPDAVAHSAVAFLGVDAVNLTAQVPPLPANVALDPSDFYNLTSKEFNPAAYIRLVGGNSPTLAAWYDFDHSVPDQPLVHGLAQSRMLGRLAFYRESQTLASRIEEAFSRTLAISRDLMEKGVIAAANAGASVPVYIVSSSCGGTGSSGLLEVIHKTWVAARRSNLTPEIRLFTYLPGVFSSAIQSMSANPTLETNNLNANAYAFFRELDHYLSHSDEVDSAVCNPGATQATNIPAGQLVKQVFAIDSKLGYQGVLTKITDSYEIVAESIYQFLMTDAGRPQVAQNGVNTEVYLQSRDPLGKKTIYCGVGIASITYPGSTLRRHLAYRYADWLVRDQFLRRDVDLPTQVREHTDTAGLVGDLGSLHGTVAAFQLPPDVLEFQALYDTAPELLGEDYSDEVITRVSNTFRNKIPRAVAALQAQGRIARDQALAEVDSKVITRFLDTGLGVPFGIEMIKHAERDLERTAELVEGTQQANQNAVPQLEQEATDAQKRIRGLNAKRIVLPGAREKAGKELGEAIQAWGSAILTQHRAANEAKFLDAARLRLTELRAELERAELRLSKKADQFYRNWRADDLIGKDAGPVDTTALIPSDIQPEVEDSAIAKQAFNEVMDLMGQTNLVELVQDLYNRWRTNDAGRAAFGLGSNNPDEAKKAEEALLTEITGLVNRYVIQTSEVTDSADPETVAKRLILPRSLLDAAERADGGESLERAMTSLVKTHKSASWAYDRARLGEVEADPAPTVAVIRPKSLAGLVSKHFGASADGTPPRGVAFFDSLDEERIVTLTTEWGVSAHAIAPVHTWQQQYDTALRRITEDSTRKRPHLDKRWSENLTDLIPVYYNREAVLDVIAGALTTSTLLQIPEVADKVFGASRGSRGVPVPLEAEIVGTTTAFKAVSFVQDIATKRWSKNRDFTFGQSYAELIDKVGNATDYRQACERLTAHVIEVAGRTKAAEAAKANLEQRFRPLQDRGSSDETEFEAIDDIAAALAELVEDLVISDLQTGVITL